MTIDHRHRCEVRYALKLRTENQQKALSYIELVGKRRGKEAALKLKDDCAAQWQRGNRGDYGAWR